MARLGLKARPGRAAVVRPGEGVSRARWESIFGPDAERAERNKAERRPLSADSGTSLPAIHDDRLYRGWNPNLMCEVRGRTHEREILKARNLQHAR